MKPGLRPLLFATALIPPNAPLAKRLEILGRHLSPKPGATLEVDQTQLRDSASIAKDPSKIHGLVHVSPPKGACFTLTTNPARLDQTICKPTWVKWFLGDMDRERAQIKWIIKTGPNDFGTPIMWQTPYAIAKVLPAGTELNTANGTPIFFKSCVASHARSDGMPRKITLTQFNNKTWLIRFPDEDKSFIEPKVEAPPPEPPKPPEGDHGGGHGDSGHGDGHGEAPKPEPPKPEPPKEEPEAWTINTGRGYGMNVGNFITDGSMPPGKKGTCRYAYDFIPGDFSRGHVECHHADQYSYVYMILPCMAAIRPH